VELSHCDVTQTFTFTRPPSNYSTHAFFSTWTSRQLSNIACTIGLHILIQIEPWASRADIRTIPPRKPPRSNPSFSDAAGLRNSRLLLVSFLHVYLSGFFLHSVDPHASDVAEVSRRKIGRSVHIQAHAACL
jgi:hypothetical protein